MPKNMGAERMKQIVCARIDGKTYDEIAEIFGITKQRAHQIVKSLTKCEHDLNQNIKYPNIAKWMSENRISQIRLGEMTGRSQSSVHAYLTGGMKLSVAFVAKLIEVTGMTFEEIIFEAGDNHDV